MHSRSDIADNTFYLDPGVLCAVCYYLLGYTVTNGRVELVLGRPDLSFSPLSSLRMASHSTESDTLK
jgi:hypothetical protein